ncbi:hypothetical protein KFL_000300450 [Klebsormidium nitens]|uniref:Uncharacterized protein n=1 Tax=Klebsormidium nitens TaxID=105231 RepID=A0A0U9HIB5_KLENI|nr:hypothetical protein KFL_000300450 [Klebsormidium nitens]|eukprot:GAQ79447.1 hypothetical protein KFL_000300450 [Klebsormidium nitens]
MSGDCKVVCQSGKATLSSFLAREDHRNFWDLDLEALVDWLGAFYTRKIDGDPIFKQRCQISSIKRQNKSRLADVERNSERCQDTYRRCGNHDEIERLTSELQKARLAEGGLATFLSDDVNESHAACGDCSTPSEHDRASNPAAEEQRYIDAKQKDKLARASQKLAEIRSRIGPLEQDLNRLCNETLEWQELQRANASVVACHDEIGLTAAENKLQGLFKDTGAQTQGSGKDFESICTGVLKTSVVPELARGVDEGRVKILSNVTLGMANGEIDKVIVCVPDAAAEPVSVLAVAECKNNVNDLAHGFSMMQSNIGWLSGERVGSHAYDPEAWKTRKYTKGHFDRTVVHLESGSEYVFGPTSFQSFKRDSEEGCFLKGVYFITRAGTLTGLGSGEINLISHKIATDLDFQEALQKRNMSYFSKLQKWVDKIKEGKLSSVDVLRLYERQSTNAGNVLLIESVK